MGTVSVEFIGICAHVIRAVDRWYHRVVLPVKNKMSDIQPHVARLHIPRAAAEEAAIQELVDGTSLVRDQDTPQHWVITLLGVELHVEDATGDYALGRFFQCGLFPLSNFTSGAALGGLDEAVWNGRRRNLAHAYFNVANGVFSAHRRGDSSAAVLQVNTSTPRVTLVATPFGATTPRKLQLADGVHVVQLSHAHSDCRDDDFLLHFELAQTPPAVPEFPSTPAPCLQAGGGEHGGSDPGLGAGCSNSTFP